MASETRAGSSWRKHYTSCYHHIPIGVLGIYRLLFVILSAGFCKAYLRRGLTQGDEINLVGW